mmetsp:Transcript_78288/g.135842  ORF Transcript_78288/g.135842 Transcript_78288/m.135842 type:complete len:532 (+) Transcript_78288:94-1689(+)
MAALKLPFVLSWIALAASLLSVAAYVAGSQGFAANEEPSRDCKDGVCIGQTDETGSFIQVLSAVIPPAPRQESSWSTEAEALLEGSSYLQSPLEWGSTLQNEAHPLWKPEWHRMLDRGALMAGICLFIGGIICTAGGIGGGGIYVTVLMFFGELSVHDAIPMSKVVVFAASLPSLILNLSKTIVLEESSAKSLIDYNVCRVVVPWALNGTLLGVYMNRHVPGEVIVGVLTMILVAITMLICRTGYKQHCEEMLAEQQAKKLGSLPSQKPDESLTTPTPKGPTEQDPPESTNGHPSRPSRRNLLFALDIKLSISTLLCVIYFGTLRFHAVSCFNDKTNDACQHPIAQIMSFGMLQRLKDNSMLATLENFVLLVPVLYCFIIAAYYCYGNVQLEDDWTWCRVASYSAMAVTTGCLAGLVGIGGGLIFAPFFIQMGIDPHVAVATSSTCVIFTSSSTTFQYLFTDRIIVALIISFGVPHLMAAYTGTKLVHFIQDNYGARKSFITWIVAFGVAVSTALAVHKLVHGDEYVKVVH